MCVVSMVGDHYRDKWQDRNWYPWVAPAPQPFVSPDQFKTVVVPQQPQITKAEFDELKKEVAELKELLKRAKAYDERNNEPDCEIDEKMDLLRKVAKLVGIELDDVLGKPDGEVI